MSTVKPSFRAVAATLAPSRPPPITVTCSVLLNPSRRARASSSVRRTCTPRRPDAPGGCGGRRPWQSLASRTGSSPRCQVGLSGGRGQAQQLECRASAPLRGPRTRRVFPALTVPAATHRTGSASTGAAGRTDRVPQRRARSAGRRIRGGAGPWRSRALLLTHPR